MEDLILNRKLLLSNPQRFEHYFHLIYSCLSDLNNEYSHFTSWYFDIVREGINNANRVIIVKEFNDEIAGVAILKNTLEEKKICTFRIFEKFKRLGLAHELMLQSKILLQTNTPLITVSEKRITEFSYFLAKNEFKLYRKYNNYYSNGIAEFAFNGPIEVSELTQNNRMRQLENTICL